MFDCETITTSVEGAVARLTLNKPARLNALDEEMLLAVEQCFCEWERRDVSVVVLAGAGQRAFCVGADIEYLSRLDPAGMERWEALGNRVLRRIEQSPLVSVACIGGYALGGGLTLALACDFRIAGRTASLGQPEIELGWIPGWGGVARLSRLVGPARTKDLCMTGRRVAATEAVAFGLANRVVPDEALEKETMHYAEVLAARSHAALSTIKALANDAPAGESAVRLDAIANAQLLTDERGQAAIRKFLERKQHGES